MLLLPRLATLCAAVVRLGHLAAISGLKTRRAICEWLFWLEGTLERRAKAAASSSASVSPGLRGASAQALAHRQHRPGAPPGRLPGAGTWLRPSAISTSPVAATRSDGGATTRCAAATGETRPLHGLQGGAIRDARLRGHQSPGNSVRSGRLHMVLTASRGAARQFTTEERARPSPQLSITAGMYPRSHCAGCHCGRVFVR